MGHADGQRHALLGGRAVGVALALGIRAVGQGGVGPVPGEEVGQCVHHQAASDLATLIATHAVGDEEEPQLRLDAVAVFVVGATTDVGESGCLHVSLAP